jgi:multidrug efflux pump subunit AcrB
VLFAPVIAVHILPARIERKQESEGRMTRLFAGGLLLSMRHRWVTLLATLALFCLSLFMLGFVQQQFFPSSDRPELLVDINLAQNSSIAQTRTVVDRLEQGLADDPDIDRWSSYIGQGAIRFYLPLDAQLQNPFFAQLVIVARDLEARDRLAERLSARLREEFLGINGYVQPLEVGPPVGRPLQYRVSGPDVDQVREQALALAGVLDADPAVGQIIYDWNEPGKVLKVDIAQDKARQLGLSSESVARLMNSVVSGATITQLHDHIYLINVVARSEEAERGSLATLENFQIVMPNGVSIPLKAFARLSYELEQPLVWRRDRLPTITLKASVNGEMQPTDLVKRLKPAIDAFAAGLPAEYRLATGGTVEESGKAQGPIGRVIPLMLFLMATFLMIQLQSGQKLLLVVSVAPLGLIGVVVALITTGTPLGFVAILGVLALIGIIIRNSVILITQIEEFEQAGLSPWNAVIEATRHRTRPILLTAAAASLGMVPIAWEIFWGPMAYAMIGGIVVATLLTLFFLPALYVAWYRIAEERDGEDGVPPATRPADTGHDGARLN